MAGKRIAVFDKYMLPKVAFTLVTTASIVGAILTGLRHGLLDWPLLALRWGAYWTLALLLGSEVWKNFYLRPSVRVRPVPRAVEYGEAMLRLHRKWQKVLLPLAFVLVTADMVLYARESPLAQTWALLAFGALVLAAGGILWAWTTRPDAQRIDVTSWLSVIGLATAVCMIATLDVTLESGQGQWLLEVNRTFHLWAFSAWLGGALWNVFIAVPAGRPRENMDTVILANFQLERFRVVVRTVFPTIITTGLIQAWAIFGWHWQSLFTNWWGYLILTKVGLILALVGVFIACPMWGACSPIRGVCNLDDLFEDEAKEAAHGGAAIPPLS
ncbi:MAG: hypothetical protein ACM3XM_16930 [Mycobacterium leprae]